MNRGFRLDMSYLRCLKMFNEYLEEEDETEDEDEEDTYENECMCGSYCFDCLGMSWSDFM